MLFDLTTKIKSRRKLDVNGENGTAFRGIWHSGDGMAQAATGVHRIGGKIVGDLESRSLDAGNHQK